MYKLILAVTVAAFVGADAHHGHNHEVRYGFDTFFDVITSYESIGAGCTHEKA